MKLINVTFSWQLVYRVNRLHGRFQNMKNHVGNFLMVDSVQGREQRPEKVNGREGEGGAKRLQIFLCYTQL